jgi:AraC family transcriptional regulator
MNIEIKHLPPTRVAYMRHTGPYGGAAVGQMWQRFTAWCEQQGFTNPRRTMYGVSQDDPMHTPADKCRYDACVEVDAAFKPDGEIGVETIPGGTLLCASFKGTDREIVNAWMMFHTWQQRSTYKHDPRPPMEIYGADYALDPATGVFTCLMAIPIKPT